MDVVIIGGGIVGLACAYSLRDLDIGVTVVEQGHIGYGSTPRAGGGIRSQFSTPVSIAMSQASIAEWERFHREFDVDISYQRNGYLYLTTAEDTANELERLVAFHNEHGVASEFVDSGEIDRYCDHIRTDHFVGGTYCATDGYADPELALHGYALAAARAGASIHLGEKVTAIKMRNGRVTGVRTNRGEIDADVVVNAAGAWAARVAALAGIDLAITPKRRQLMVVQPTGAFETTEPLVTDLSRGVYFRPRTTETMYVAGHLGGPDGAASPDSFDRTHDPEWEHAVLNAFSEVSTVIGPDARVDDGWAGLYAMTPDHHPIIDEVIPGFIVAAGFSGHGFMHAPATGTLVTELVTGESVSGIDASQLSADRFEQGRSLDEVFYSA